MSGGCYTLRGAASPCGVLPPQRQTPAKAERPRKQAGTAAIVAESRTGDWLFGVPSPPAMYASSCLFLVDLL